MKRLITAISATHPEIKASTQFTVTVLDMCLITQISVFQNVLENITIDRFRQEEIELESSIFTREGCGDITIMLINTSLEDAV